jgi:hypothetical protein
MSTSMKCFIGSKSRSVKTGTKGNICAAVAMKTTRKLKAIPRTSNFWRFVPITKIKEELLYRLAWLFV